MKEQTALISFAIVNGEMVAFAEGKRLPFCQVDFHQNSSGILRVKLTMLFHEIRWDTTKNSHNSGVKE